MMSEPPSPPRTPTFATYVSRSPSPLYDDRPIIPTDDRGMVIEDGRTSEQSASEVRAIKKRKPQTRRQPIQYVSKHFTAATDTGATKVRSKRSQGNLKDVSKKAVVPKDATRSRKKHVAVELGHKVKAIPLVTPPRTPVQLQPRIYYGLNVDELSSDSSLTDVPNDIGPDPFDPPVELIAVKSKSTRTPKKPKHPTTSPYFPTPHRARPHFLSTLPFPPLSNATFGLMQERLCKRPFDLLLATIFLNKTPGERAMPVCYQLLSTYTTPEVLSQVEVDDITSIIRHLGFQHQRAHKIVGLAKGWVEREPYAGVRYRKMNYPCKGDGRDIKADEEPIADEADDSRVAWEISHLPGLGPYSHDSWRMFCRDMLRGLATGYNGEGAVKGFEPEWKRVLPKDKELRAWMAWMWLKEGYVWNCETGKRTKASEELMDLARGGGVVVEEHRDGEERMTIEQGMSTTSVDVKVQRPAGEVLDQVKAEA